ncbi:hypothetical protein P4E94_19245 [Pontiellaceae bacterium B12219]|nr:hypothetical protein [Pontiellaceae bacterium B12219]
MANEEMTLSLAREIAKAHGGKLTLKQSDKTRTCDLLRPDAARLAVSTHRNGRITTKHSKYTNVVNRNGATENPF